MVDVEFKSRARNFIPLSVLKGIAAGDTPDYMTSGDVAAIKGHSHLSSRKLMAHRLCTHRDGTS